jgi:AFG3 family protein
MKKIKNLLKNFNFWIILILLFILVFPILGNRGVQYISISDKKFEQFLFDNKFSEVVLYTNKNRIDATLDPRILEFELNKLGEIYKKSIKKVVYTMKVPSIEIFNSNFKNIEKMKNLEERIGYKVSEKHDLLSFLDSWGNLIFMILIFLFFMRKISGGKNGHIFSIGNSKAVLFDEKNKDKITFKDVAGMKEAKEEIKEIVDFLKNKEKFLEFGAKIPKGVLLIGSPGTGKTLLAKAVAGEAGVPFFSLSGSDFVEMFVGVGASRVRDLFQKAKEKSPSIIFIDEIDAIGRARGKSNIGGNDERENTLNSLLVEMDGFSTDSGVIVIAATNRVDILDKAILRPGRFDRQIGVENPDIVDREEIFDLYLSKLKKLSSDINAKNLAMQTAGFSGADIANVCNEAALIAARKNSEKINKEHFQDSLDRIIGGLEKKNKIISKKEKKIVAYHEAGHTIASWYLESSKPFVKVTIVPRGIAALGYAQYLSKDQYIYQKNEILEEICTLLAGRVSEEIFFENISTGALNDLERSTKIAYNLVALYGMNEKLGHLSFREREKEDMNFTKPFSESTSYLIDQEVKSIISESYDKAKNILLEKKEEVILVAEKLLEKEVLFKSDLEELIGKKKENLD